MSPQYKAVQGNSATPQLTGYRVNHLLHVKLRTPDQLGRLLDTLIDAGSNVLRGVRFSVDSSMQLTDQARDLAVVDAHRKASQLAKAGAVELGRVVMMVEGAGGGAMPFRQGAMDMRVMSAVPVAAGAQSFSVSVTVTYAIK